MAQEETRNGNIEPLNGEGGEPGVESPAAPGAAPAGGEPGAPDPETLRADLSHWQRKAEENLDLARRAQAELENFRRRTARDVENAHKYALDRFVNDLLPVIDSLELGIEAARSAGDIERLREGMDLTLKMFRDTLQKSGVSVVDPAGQKFDAERHQAVSTQESGGAEPGTVVSVMQKGYELNGRLVRPALVVVAR